MFAVKVNGKLYANVRTLRSAQKIAGRLYVGYTDMGMLTSKVTIERA